MWIMDLHITLSKIYRSEQKEIQIVLQILVIKIFDPLTHSLHNEWMCKRIKGLYPLVAIEGADQSIMIENILSWWSWSDYDFSTAL